MTIEHWGWISPDENPEGKTHSWNERQDDFASVAFWYQTGKPTFTARAPDAKERTLPNLDVIFPAKSLVDVGRHGEGEWNVQSNLDFYPDGQLLFKPAPAENAWVEIPFTVNEKEPRRLLLAVTRADDYGTYQAYLDGVKLGRPIDLYANETSPWEWHLSGLLARAGRVHAAPGVRRQEPRLDRPPPGHRVGPAARAPPPRQGVGPRQGQELAREADAVRLTPATVESR